MKQVILAFILIAVPVALFSGYELYTVNTAEAASTGLGDLSQFKTIIADVQALAEKGDIARAQQRVTDFESAWDSAETAIRPRNQTQWGNIDDAADAALKAVRATTPAPDTVKSSLAALMAVLTDPGKPA